MHEFHLDSHCTEEIMCKRSLEMDTTGNKVRGIKGNAKGDSSL